MSGISTTQGYFEISKDVVPNAISHTKPMSSRCYKNRMSLSMKWRSACSLRTGSKLSTFPVGVESTTHLHPGEFLMP